MSIVRRLFANSSLLFVLAFGLLALPACDSGGSNGSSGTSGSSDGGSTGGSGSSSNNVVEVTDNLDGNLTLKVEGTDAFYQWEVQEVDRNDDGAVVHNADNENNTENGTDEVDVPKPSELGGGSNDPNGFDEYEIAVTDESNDDKDLTIILLKDGTEIAKATDALEEDPDFVNDFATKGDWAIKALSP